MKGEEGGAWPCGRLEDGELEDGLLLEEEGLLEGSARFERDDALSLRGRAVMRDVVVERIRRMVSVVSFIVAVVVMI